MTNYLTCTTGTGINRKSAQVEYTGKLTPALAVAAAKKAFGHANGVTVSDGTTTYRCTNDKAKKKNPPTWAYR